MRVARIWSALAAIAIVTACGSDTTGTSQSASSAASRATTTTTTRSDSQASLAADQVAEAVRKVTGASPLLLPMAIPPGFTADVTTSADAFEVIYRSPDRTQTLTIAIVVANPALPTDHTAQSNPNFHGDGRSLYQVDDTTRPDTLRTLLWTEPGRWSLENRDGVPYSLTATGLTDSKFWQYANSIQPIST